MLKTRRIITVSLAISYLAACSIDGTNSNSSTYESNAQTIYPDSYDSYNYQYKKQDNYYSNPTPPSAAQKVNVPDSYHVGSIGGPTSAKDMDKNWVNKQNPNSYTIEIANDSKPSKVAGILYKAPKNEKSAEIKTNNGNYTGVYGTYPSYEAAQEKLKSLPEDVKQNANIKSWGSIQGSIDE